MIEQTIRQLIADRQCAWDAQKAVIEAAQREARAFTADEKATIERIDAELDTKDAEVRAWTERLDREREAEKARAAYEPFLAPQQEARREASEREEIVSFLRGERRSIDFDMRAVAREKALLRSGAEGRDVITRDMLVGTSTAGGDTVPTSFVRALYDFLEVFSGVRRYTNIQVITTNGGESIDLPKVTSHGTAAIVGEGTAVAEADPAVAKTTLGAWRYGQLIQISRELLDDTGVDILGFLARDAGRALGRVTNTDYTTGSGSNKPLGFLVTYATAVTGQNSATGLPSYANLVDMVYSVNEDYRMEGACWTFRDATIGKIRGITDTTGRPIWEPNSQVGQPDRLLGFPVIGNPAINAMATGVAVGAFGNFRGFVIRDAGTIRFERSDDFAFDKDLVTFRSILRTDSDLVDTTCVRVYKGGTA